MKSHHQSYEVMQFHCYQQSLLYTSLCLQLRISCQTLYKQREYFSSISLTLWFGFQKPDPVLFDIK